ncbi:MAG TPA: MFS transporter [Nitrososphaerales archaeon]|nr:MFS transporter [Nitrososphaerales archaeon]
MLDWINADGKIVLATKSLRRFSYGFLGVTVAVYLGMLGYDGFTIGIMLTTAVFGATVLTLVASVVEARLGRKTLLLVFSLLMLLAGVVYALSTDFVVLLLAALLGTLNVTGNEFGAFLSLEQSIIPQTCEPRRVTFAYALYNVFGALAGAGGALLGGIPDVFQHSFGLSPIDSFKPIFIMYSAVAVAVLVGYARLSVKAEAPRAKGETQLVTPRTRTYLLRMSGFFAVDALGGSLLIQSIISYWFFTEFGVSLIDIGIIFSVAGVLTAAMFLVAARLTEVIGALRTMTFIHVPSDGLLILIPFFPNFLAAMVLYLASMAISQMDVPSRQSYLVSIVEPHEMLATASSTNISRNLAQIPGPTLAGYLIQFVSLSAPFTIGGSVRLVNSLAIYLAFRKVPTRMTTAMPVEEPAGTVRSAGQGSIQTGA